MLYAFKYKVGSYLIRYLKSVGQQMIDRKEKSECFIWQLLVSPCCPAILLAEEAMNITLDLRTHDARVRTKAQPEAE